MKIQINNNISIDDQIEKITEVYDCELIEKGNYLYLIYHNSEAEKVVIKLNGSEMTMSRFSKPQSIMKFLKDKESFIMVPTPMGIQQFILKTHNYHFQPNQNQLNISYDLAQVHSEAIFASYQLEVKWY